MGVRTYIMAMAVLWTAGGLVGAAEPAATSDEPVGIRFTPEMARAIARKIVPTLKRYELPDDKKDEAAEKIARRLMEVAHAMDGRGQELVRRWMEEQMADEASGLVGGDDDVIPPRFGKELADRVLEVLPPIKDLLRNVGQDIRPMLPMKQQLKLGAELMAAKTGIDAFQMTMQKWSSGEITDYGDPFGQSRSRKVKKDESGQSEDLKNARKTAQVQLDKFAVDEWDRYAQQFKTFHALDPAECATVDSIVREFKQRAEQRKRDAAWRDRYYRNQTWLNIFWRVPRNWNHPIRLLIEDDQVQVNSWLDELSGELKTRLETVPTDNQRKTAETRIDSLLKEKGIVLEGTGK